MSKPVAVDAKSFPEEVLQSQQLTIVDFWAPWCGPCHMISPVLEELAQEKADQLKIAKVNVDENQQLAGQYQIMSIPTLLFFKGGQVVDQMIGAVSKEKIVQTVEKHL